MVHVAVFEQDPDPGRITRLPPAVCPFSRQGWTPLATLVPAAGICHVAAVSSQGLAPVSSTLFPIDPIIHVCLCSCSNSREFFLYFFLQTKPKTPQNHKPSYKHLSCISSLSPTYFLFVFTSKCFFQPSSSAGFLFKYIVCFQFFFLMDKL